MKKGKILFGLVIPVLSGCSCSMIDALFGETFSWSNYKNNEIAMSLESKKFKNFKFENYSDLESKQENLRQIVVQKGNYSKFVSAYNEMNSIYVNLIDSYIISSTKYYADNSSENQSRAADYYAKYLSLNKFLVSLETDIYNSSAEIKKAYFGNLTDAEIEKRLQENQLTSLGSDYEKIFSDYKDEGQKLYQKYQKDKNKVTYLDTGYDYLLRYVNKANELVDQLPSYNNYLEYSYDNDYKRDYKYTDTDPFVNYVKSYLVPIRKRKSEIQKPTNIDSTLFQVISFYNFCNRGSDMSEVFTSYADAMGGRYLNCYNNAFRYGYYCFSNSSNSMGTAFEWNLNGEQDAVLFFSRQYQDVLSITHEFGHYYSCIQGDGARRGDAYDLQETYSQGNEFTFCKYLLEQKQNDANAATYNYFVDDKIYDSIGQIINEAAITEIEKFAFTTPNLTKQSLIDGVNAILASYDGTASDVYFMGPCLTSPCYYVSYATSLIEALQFAAMPTFEEAKEKYTKLVEASGALTMVQRWENAGLTSPFDERTFQTLANLFTSVANKY